MERLELKEVQKLEGHTDRVWSLDWNPATGHAGVPLVFASCSGDKTVRIWEQNLSNSLFSCKAVLEETHTRTVRSCAWSPSGKLLATATFDATTAIWENVGGDFECVSTLESHTETGIRGTKGYVAPDWFRSAPITAKVDTYSFGVLLLEIICCRKNVEKEFVNEEQGILTDWAYDCYKTKRLDNLLENDNEVGNDMMSLEKLVMIVIWCIQEDPSLRPTMKEVLLMLEGIVEVVVPRSPYLYGSVSIDSDTYSDTINSKKTQKAIRVMEILEKHGQDDVFAYEALLNGYCKADIVDAANKECLCTMGVLFNYYCTLLCNFHFIRFVNHPNFVQVTATDVVIGEATVIVIGNNVTILYDASKVFDEISDRTLILKVSGLLRGDLNIGEVGCPPDAISYNNNYANVQLILEIAEITHVDAVWPG
ncbi:hypothetical protein RYX36_010260 [Vicia faba]